MVLYKSVTLPNFYVETDEDISEFLSKFIDRKSVFSTVNDYMDKQNMKHVDENEFNGINNYDLLKIVFKDINTKVPSYEFVETNKNEYFDENKDNIDQLTKIETEEDYIMFEETIGSYWE